MKSRFLLLILIFVCGCTKPDEFKATMMELGTAFTAKGFCSCLFVVGQSEDFCRDYAALTQVSPKLTVDLKSKTTESTLFWVFARRAKYSAEHGCVLE